VSGSTASIKRCLSACQSTHRAIDLGGSTFECVATCNLATYFRQLKTINSVSTQICASNCSTGYNGAIANGGPQTSRLYYYISGGERICTTSCNRIRALNEDKTVTEVLSGDALYEHKYEKQETISTVNYIQCVTSAGCGSLYTEGLDDEFGATKSFLCVNKCSDSNEHIYRFGNKGVTTPVVEYCVKSCTAQTQTPLRRLYFTNSDGDYECTSECPPLAAESNKHVTSGPSALTSALIFEYNNQECLADCSLHSTSQTDPSGVSKNECLSTCYKKDDNLTPTSAPGLFRNVHSINSKNEVVCHPRCLPGTGGSPAESYYFIFDFKTPATSDDEKICASKCPPVIGDLSTVNISSFNSDATVVANLATYIFVASSADTDNQRQCTNTCPLYRRVAFVSGASVTFTGTSTCVTACNAGEYVFKNPSLASGQQVFCITQTDTEFEFKSGFTQTNIFRIQNAAGQLEQLQPSATPCPPSASLNPYYNDGAGADPISAYLYRSNGGNWCKKSCEPHEAYDDVTSNRPCRTKCDSTGTYKFREVQSGSTIGICKATCASGRYYTTSDGELVCTATDSCAGITNARLPLNGTTYPVPANDPNNYALFTFRDKNANTYSLWHCVPSCTDFYYLDGTENTCSPTCPAKDPSGTLVAGVKYIYDEAKFCRSLCPIYYKDDAATKSSTPLAGTNKCVDSCIGNDIYVIKPYNSSNSAVVNNAEFLKCLNESARTSSQHWFLNKAGEREIVYQTETCPASSSISYFITTNKDKDNASPTPELLSTYKYIIHQG